jgi:site-specific DNA-methyltransferase (adenine-specific)
MKPTFESNGITLYNADNMEIMAQYPDKYFDLAIVDPPYGIGDIRQSKSRNLHSKIKWNNQIPSIEYFNELERVSKNRIIWGINYYAKYVDDVGRIIHDKTGHGNKNQLHELSDADIASHSFGVNVKIFHYVWQGNAQGSSINWKNTGEDSRIHPTQKPIALYEWLLKNYAKNGDKILDTHLGSGSITIAIDKANVFDERNFKFIGIELDSDYFADSVKRFKTYKQQGTLPFN